MCTVQVVFSDESIIQCKEQRVQHVRRMSGESLRDDCVVQSVNHPTQVMVRSVMSVFGTGRLRIVEGHMNEQQYKTIPEKQLIPQLNEWASKRGFSGTGNLIFIHDGAPCHRCRSVAEFLDAHGIERLPWLGNSPGKNPIESPLSILKSEMQQKTIMNKRKLIEELISAWRREDSVRNACSELVRSMPAHVAAVNNAKGSFTKH